MLYFIKDLENKTVQILLCFFFYFFYTNDVSTFILTTRKSGRTQPTVYFLF